MFWSGPKDTAAPGIANKIVIVVPGFVTEEGKFEAILAGGFSVAPSSVAAVFREDGNKVVGEGNVGGFSRSHFDGLRNAEFTVGGSESRSPAVRTVTRPEGETAMILGGALV